MNNKLFFSISLMILLLSGLQVAAQTDLQCRGFVNSSAGINCDFQLDAQELLSTDVTGRKGLEITVGNHVGIDVLLLGSDLLNQSFNFSVRDTLTDVICWGVILFEDVLIPQPECIKDTVACTEKLAVDTSSLPVPDSIKARADYEAVLIEGSPCFEVSGWDACGPVILCYEEQTRNFTCDPLFCSVLYRHWTLTDPLISLNKPAETSCIDTIFISLPERDSLFAPPNWLKPDSAISCSDLNHNMIKDILEDNLIGVTTEESEKVIEGDTKAWIPTPEVTGYPNGIECTDCLIVHWKDHVIEGDCSRFIERTWKIRGWCSNHDLDTTFVQQIKIVDDQAPVITTCIDQITLYVSGHECKSKKSLPIPEAYDECDDHKYLKGVNYSVTTDKGRIVKQGEDYLLDLDLSLYLTGNDPHYTDATITWIIDDGCGNQDTCTYIARVEDNTPPVAAAISNIAISLTTDGFGKLFATDEIDAGSSDNCGDIYFKVLRHDDEEIDLRKHGSSSSAGSFPCNGVNGDDSDMAAHQVYFDDYVKFCCEDINEEVKVIFRVYDWLPLKWRQGPVPREAHENDGELVGHYNDQWTLVKVEDKLGALNCPSDVVINCDEHLPSLEVTGNTVCGPLDVQFVGDIDNRDPCGIGNLVRNWRTLLPDGSYVICSQKITILPLPLDNFFINDKTCVNTDRNDGVIWPCDKEIECPSGLDDLTPEMLNSKPVIFDDIGACNNVFIGSDDIVLYNASDACLKILRTWVVIDWCGTPINNVRPRWFYEQNIKLIDNTPPELEVDVYSKCDSISSCKVFTRIELNVDDACSELNQISVDYTIDDDAITGTGVIFDGYLAPGEHTIYYSVLDGCDNYAFTEATFDIVDCKPPTPVCNVGIGTVVMPSTGEVPIWARELDAGTKEDCEELIFGIRRATNEGEDQEEFAPFITLTCDDIYGAESSTVFVDMQVTDLFGNSAYCTSFVNLQDNANVCPDKPFVGGTITMNNGTPLVGHDVVLTDIRGAALYSAVTNNDGQYAFPEIEGAVYVRPRKNDDVVNGVNTLDLISIQRHFLGIKTFEKAYLHVAADASNDENINVLDLLEIQKVVLGTQSQYTNNSSWRYMMSRDIPDLNEPYTFTERVDISILNQTQIQTVDFIGVKVGDVNESASASGVTQIVSSSRSNLEMIINTDQIKLSRQIRIPMTSTNFNEVQGYQMTISFNPNELEFVDIESGVLFIEEHNVATQKANEGQIAHNWYDTEALSLSNEEVLFTMVFNAISSSINWHELRITNDLIHSEYYQGNKSAGLTLIVSSRAEIESMTLYQNAPNPFNERTILGFDLPEDSEISLTVYDIQGKQVLSKNLQGFRGYNEEILQGSDLGNASGVLYYRISNDSINLTKKMVRTD